MGTNYYHIEAGGEGKIRHIGKSSMGWVFALHVYPEEGIHTLTDWGLLFVKAGSVFEDEYGKVLGRTDILRAIIGRKGNPLHKHTPYMLGRNHAQVGPNNLLRTRIDGVRCIGHGAGTYEYHVGDFS